jgi:hypothetical protein
VDSGQEGEDVLIGLRWERRKVEFTDGIGELWSVFGKSKPFGQCGDDLILDLVDLSGLYDEWLRSGGDHAQIFAVLLEEFVRNGEL